MISASLEPPPSAIIGVEDGPGDVLTGGMEEWQRYTCSGGEHL